MRFVYYEIAEYLQAHRFFMKGKPNPNPNPVGYHASRNYDVIQQTFVVHTDLKAEKYSRNLSSDRLETNVKAVRGKLMF